VGLPRMYCEKEKVRGEKEMSEKVLGFWKRDGKFNSKLGWVLVEESELVPVRLESESVELKWLEKYCRIIPSKSLTQYEIGYTQAFKDLLYAVRAKAKKANK